MTFSLIAEYFKSRVGRAYSGRPRESTEGRPQSQIPGEVGWKGAQASGPVKKPLTAESAETEEKKTLRSFGVLGVLGGKTAHFFHTLSRACLVDLVGGLGVVAGSEACVSPLPGWLPQKSI